MIVRPSANELVEKVENRYELSNIIAKRSRQIQSGAEPKVNTKEKSTVTIASLEFEKDMFYVIDNNKQ